MWTAAASSLQGAAMAATGFVDDGLVRLEAAMHQYRALKSPPVFWPSLLQFHAEVLGRAGRPSEGVARVEEALAGAWPHSPNRKRCRRSCCCSRALCCSGTRMIRTRPRSGSCRAVERADQLEAPMLQFARDLRPCPTLGRAGQDRIGCGVARRGVRAVHRGFRDGRSDRRQTPARRTDDNALKRDSKRFSTIGGCAHPSRRVSANGGGMAAFSCRVARALAQHLRGRAPRRDCRRRGPGRGRRRAADRVDARARRALRARSRRHHQSRRKRRFAGVPDARFPRSTGCRVSPRSCRTTVLPRFRSTATERPTSVRSTRSPSRPTLISGPRSTDPTSSPGALRTRHARMRWSSTRRRPELRTCVPVIICVWRSSTPPTCSEVNSRRRRSSTISASWGSLPGSTMRAAPRTIRTSCRQRSSRRRSVAASPRSRRRFSARVSS